MTPDQALELLLKLIRQQISPRGPEGLGRDDNLVISSEAEGGVEKSLSESEWLMLISVARQQTVTGLLYKAAENLPPGTKISERVLFTLMSDVNVIVNHNLKLGEVEKEVLGILTGGGLHPVVMKGSSCAARYPSPELRTGGDVDLYLDKDEFSKAVELIRAAGIASDSRPDGSVEFTRNGCEVELHRQYFDLHVRESVLPPVGTPEAELVMLSAHILKHACGVGIGLRQIIDYDLAYKAYPGDYDTLYSIFRRCGISRWNTLLLSFIKDYIDPTINARRYVNPRALFRIVRDGGNFGHYQAGRLNSVTARSALRRKLDTAGRLLSRLPFSLRFAPRETMAYVASLVKGNL